MKSCLAFLLLLVLVLPAREWKDVFACGAGACGPDISAVSCACCEADGCHCAAEKDEGPTAPLHSPLPRSVSAGDPMFFVSVENFTSCLMEPRRAWKCMSEKTTDAAPKTGTVPLYRRHCAMLC